MQRKIDSCFVLLLLITLPFLSAYAQSHAENEHFLTEMNMAAEKIFLLNNRQNILPVKNIHKRKFVSLDLGFRYQTVFDSLLNKYDLVKSLKVTPNNNFDQNGLDSYTTIIVALDDNVLQNKKVIQLISEIAKRKELILCFFGLAKNIPLVKDISASIVWSKDNNSAAAFIVPQIVFGGISLNEKDNAIRLKFTVPEDVNINSNDLLAIDSIAAMAIAQKATPGLVVLAAKDGKVFFNKAYGTHTYDDNVPDKITDLFDLASVTKITATTPVVMRLYDENELNLDTTIGYYLKRARTAAMNNIHIREVMLHQAGFVPFIPFYKELTKNDYSIDSSVGYPTKVADHFYIKENYFQDVMWPQMLAAPIRTRGKYVYSDISMYTMQQIVEHITDIPLNRFVLDSFYKPLGMQTAGYLPRTRFNEARIIPTEKDTSFRHQLLVGYVHDEGAALKGGVAGHAGLFANSIDLAIYYQMLLNGGSYGGVQYFKPQTVSYFTGKRSDVSRRGLGFDRADTSEHYPSRLASPETFGHTGFTGIGVWVDKPRNLVYIFLSNRVNPDRSGKIYQLGTRSKMEDVFNTAIDNSMKH